MADERERLCRKDRDILESIFSPTSTFGLEYVRVIGVEAEVNGQHEAETENEKKARENEVEAVEKAEQGDLSSAISLLNDAIHIDPENASVYNNRAQVHLLNGRK